jgi:hypothetical protein
MEITKEWADRFNAKWKLNNVNGCWEWSGSVTTVGYGQIKIPKARRQMPAHRLSYLIHRGQIPQGQYVLHKCDNRICVNPDHLFVGTMLDNSHDMVRKNRHCFGERQGAHKLSEADARKILELIKSGMKQVRIAQMMGIGPMQVSRIKHGLRWAHLQK